MSVHLLEFKYLSVNDNTSLYCVCLCIGKHSDKEDDVTVISECLKVEYNS